MNELFINGSGYNDPTAYQAVMRKFEGGRNVMTWFNDGDIVKYESGVGSGTARAVLIKCFDRYCTGMKIYEEKPDENSFAVIGKTKGFVDTGKLIWISNPKVISLERTLTDKEFDDIREAVRNTLGFVIPIPGEKTKEEETEPVHTASVISVGITAEEITDAIQKAFADLKPELAETIRSQAERDVYKQLYQQERENG